MVGERSVRLRSLNGSLNGAIRRANADVSNDNTSEKLVRRKTKGFYPTLIEVELVGA